MQHKIFQAVFHAALLVTLAFASACTTLDYRSVQGEFADAVAADNAWSVSPLGGNAADGLYGSIHTELTDMYIAGLDARLRPNAWLLRAVSAWRLGDFSDARTSAVAGIDKLSEVQRGSRDHVMLAMLDGLIIDSDLLIKFRDRGNRVTINDYQSIFSPDFDTGLKALDDGFAQAGPATPPEMGWYYHYHRWRLLQNWRTVVNSINDQDRATARADSEGKVGQDLRQAMEEEKGKIPDNHPLHLLIFAHEKS
ncbi:hypothetical protein [Candidatus Nitrospira neomarina]|uniref:Lipoprotein n=1 Tax=Candidatus Nitrospira neomarina TaxID=3020899 RepID=A0AA96GN77_9BACT|nr:hypothetical protein [Candidatus Nitrospira neomarina]WNM62268.1 hypothetical protein PQG83_00555 [Candidatus Nitrospira neomarina]